MTYRNAVREDRATATGNMYEKFAEFGHLVFEICEQDRQTDRQRDVY